MNPGACNSVHRSGARVRDWGSREKGGGFKDLIYSSPRRKNQRIVPILNIPLSKTSSVKTIISDIFILPHCILNVGG